MGVRPERGAGTLTLLAPVLAAVIGGGAAVAAAVQIVALAPATEGASSTGAASDADGPADGTTAPEVLYGSR